MILRPSLHQSRITPACKRHCDGRLEATSIFLPSKTLLSALPHSPARKEIPVLWISLCDNCSMCPGASEKLSDSGITSCLQSKSLPLNGWNKSGFDLHALTDHHKMKMVGTWCLKTSAWKTNVILLERDAVWKWKEHVTELEVICR